MVEKRRVQDKRRSILSCKNMEGKYTPSFSLGTFIEDDIDTRERGLGLGRSNISQCLKYFCIIIFLKICKRFFSIIKVSDIRLKICLSGSRKGERLSLE